MTPNQFWEEDPQLLWAYLDAYKQKIQEQIEYDNQKAYNQGCYFLLALKEVIQFTSSPKHFYPKKPFDVEDKKKKKLDKKDVDMIRKLQFMRMEQQLNR